MSAQYKAKDHANIALLKKDYGAKLAARIQQDEALKLLPEAERTPEKLIEYIYRAAKEEIYKPHNPKGLFSLEKAGYSLFVGGLLCFIGTTIVSMSISPIALSAMSLGIGMMAFYGDTALARTRVTRSTVVLGRLLAGTELGRTQSVIKTYLGSKRKYQAKFFQPVRSFTLADIPLANKALKEVPASAPA